MHSDIRDDFRKHQTSMLFLLVGQNPLPNYVAARLLAKEKGQVCLLHSSSTMAIAENLKAQLEKTANLSDVISCEIHQGDAYTIRDQVGKILANLDLRDRDVGLNYTGGTKPMSVHVYHFLRSRFPRGRFSYLDATTLKMMIGHGDEPTQMPSTHRAVELELAEIVALHGYTLDEPRRTSQYPELYRPLAEICAIPEGLHQWAGGWNDRAKSKGWLKSNRPLTALPAQDEYPRLAPIVAAFEQLGGTPDAVAQHLEFSKLESCRNWFKGTWLEEYTLEALTKAAGELDIRSLGIGLKPKPLAAAVCGVPKEFELDLAAMVGYQLFAISCIVSQEKGGETKKHLFEAFVRARQLGGDEARVGLVCCVETPDVLQREIERKWDARGKIRVFGRRDLRPLAARLREWIRTANREGT